MATTMSNRKPLEAGSKTKSSKMEREALKMEAKLMELRNAMAREREKRDAVRGNNGGYFWNSGQAAGNLRGHKPGTLPKSTAPSGPPPARPLRPASSTTVPSKDATPQHRANHVVRFSDQGRSAEVGAESGTTDEGGVDGGLGLDGDFDEDESAASFQAALAEWRGEPVPAKTVPAKNPSMSQHTMECQTEIKPPVRQRPQSAKNTYFEHLLNARSNAGDLADCVISEEGVASKSRENPASESKAELVPKEPTANSVAKEDLLSDDDEIDIVDAFPEYFPEYHQSASTESGS